MNNSNFMLRAKPFQCGNCNGRDTIEVTTERKRIKTNSFTYEHVKVRCSCGHEWWSRHKDALSA